MEGFIYEDEVPANVLGLAREIAASTGQGVLVRRLPGGDFEAVDIVNGLGGEVLTVLPSHWRLEGAR